MKMVSVAEAKARFSEMLACVERGETITITWRGRPVAGLTPLSSAPLPLDRDFFAGVEQMPVQEQDAGSFVRWMRGTDRF